MKLGIVIICLISCMSVPEPPHRGNDAVGDFAVPDVPERPGYSSGTKRSPVFRQYL